MMILRSSTVTAAAWGKHILVTSALADLLSSQELDSIVAHEQAHIDLHHRRYTVILELCLVYLIIRIPVLSLISPTLSIPLIFILSTLLLSLYSRKTEYEADQVAFQQFGDIYTDALKKLPSYKTNWFSSHPSMDKRILCLT